MQVLWQDSVSLTHSKFFFFFFLRKQVDISQLAVLKLFNVILSVGYFPDIWNQGLITPIFKNGDKFDPNNYRGICVSSNLGKLFCSIINARLLDFITTHNVLSRSQIGFLPNYRTSDHIYTLHTLIEKHVNQDKGKIYACFIDLKKLLTQFGTKDYSTNLLKVE